MDMKELIAKAIAGSLTDDDKTTLATFDPDALAASSRRKAEEQAAALKTQLESLQGNLKEKESESMTAAERLQATIEELTGKVGALEKAKSEAEGAVKAAQRRDALSKLRQSSGIEFVPGIDPELADFAWTRAFEGVESPAEAPDVKNRITGFVQKNAALIVDRSGSGTGIKPSPSNVIPADDINARAKELKQKGLV